ncbi:hypothetical protein ACOMHN_005318 [Nucella lapillus]
MEVDNGMLVNVCSVPPCIQRCGPNPSPTLVVFPPPSQRPPDSDGGNRDKSTERRGTTKTPSQVEASGGASRRPETPVQPW